MHLFRAFVRWDRFGIDVGDRSLFQALKGGESFYQG